MLIATVEATGLHRDGPPPPEDIDQPDEPAPEGPVGPVTTQPTADLRGPDRARRRRHR